MAAVGLACTSDPRVDGCRLRIGDLCLRQRRESQDPGPSGQGLADGRHREEVGGAGEQEPARGLILVHEQLDDPDQPVTGDLHLVHHQRRRPTRQERHGIVEGGLQHRLVLERDVRSAGLSGDEPSQGRLARLARPVQDHDAESAERVSEPVC